MIYRNTRQRKEVYDVIKGVNRHLTAEQVMEVLKNENKKVGLATVYRNLNYLSENKLIRKFEENGVVFYDGNPETHDHLHCVICNKYFDIPSLVKDKDLSKIEHDWGFKVEEHFMTYEGVCGNCRKIGG